MRKLPLDRITMIEQARLQREVQYGSARLSEAVVAADSRQPAESTGPDFTDTVKFKSPVIQLTAEKRESERLLPPGASGPNGAAYKLLRTQVLRRLDKLNVNTLAVMSAGAADGKTLTAINLAISIAAQQDRTALLVDLDLRNPNVHRRFGFEPAVGIEECIESRRAVQDAMVKIAGYDKLTILPARERVQHSSELLSAHRTAEMMQEMRARYANRILIFDLPPVLLADDALAFSRIVQAGLIVVGEGRTKRGDVTRSIRLLNDLPIVGTVLNGSRDAVNVYY